MKKNNEELVIGVYDENGKNVQDVILKAFRKYLDIELKKPITYTQVGDYKLTNLTIKETNDKPLNKYGLLRLEYLKEHKKAEYTIMFMENTLIDHLEEIQEIATKRVNQIIDDLKAKSNLTEDMKNTDMLYWVGTMNAIRQQAEEIILNELIYV